MPRSAGCSAAFVALALYGCGDSASPLPPIPHSDGPLRVTVVHPSAGDPVPATGLAPILGSVGSGDAELRIDGRPVRVLPNGAFLSYQPVPPAGAPHYELLAVLGRDTVRRWHPVERSRPLPPLGSQRAPFLDSASVFPRHMLMLRGDEPVRVGVRAADDATVRVEWSGGGQHLVNEGALAHGTEAEWSPRPLRAAPGAESYHWETELPARTLRGGATLVVARGRDTVRVPLAAVEETPDPARWGVLGPAEGATGDAGDAGFLVSASPTPGGTFAWFFLPGTRVAVTGRREGHVRVRLDEALEAWVAERDVHLLPPGAAGPARVTAGARLVADSAHVDLVLPVGSPPPFRVREGSRTLILTLYGTLSGTGLIRHAPGDTLVRRVEWDQPGRDRTHFVLHLSRAPFGYRVFWADGALVLRVRRPPRVSSRSPLRGLTVAVDPGHPPHGATGPTGLREADVTLAVARRLRRLLEERGATVVMTRTSDAAVALDARPAIARRADAHVLVSIHVDASPPGVDPAAYQGTSTHYFHPHAERLAREIQRGMVARLGLPDRGVALHSLALVRPTWMPAVLCEGATLTIPEQEAALRTDAFQQRYARGVVDGLEAYLRTLAAADRE